MAAAVASVALAWCLLNLQWAHRGGREAERDERSRQAMSETVAAIVAAHRSGAASPEATIAQTYARIRAHADPAIFITLREEADALAEAKALTAAGNTALPLY